MQVNHARDYKMTAPVSQNGLTATIETHEAHGTVRHFSYGESASLKFNVQVTGKGSERVLVQLANNGEVYAHVPAVWTDDDRDQIAEVAKAAVAAYCQTNKL